MSSAGIILLSLGYLFLLFFLAFTIDQRVKKGKTILKNPWIYSLSLGVYCTAWTYYGSVGKAVNDGISFLTIYLGPILIMPLFWIIVRKMIRICQVQRISTLADFISARYGKSVLLSVLVSLLAILGVIPYISIQLKAISSSFNNLILGDPMALDYGFWSIFTDSAFYLTIILAVFVILFAFRTPDTTDKHEGMIGAIAFESIVKLVAFLAVGIYITYFVFDGFGDLFRNVPEELLPKFIAIEETGIEWSMLLLLSMSAILLLPRQFQVTVTENTNENHLKHASWVFPTYLLLINVFVIPIALAGQVHLSDQVDPDSYVLAMPLSFGHEGLAIFTFLGGFSAATSMIIVSTAALSIMVSNNILVPITLKRFHLRDIFDNFPLISRRVSVFVILLSSYLYYHFISQQYSLVSIGLISFAAIIQFMPSVLGALFWKDANRTGTLMGMITGFLIWFYTLVVPTMVEVGIMPDKIISEGILGIRPENLFGLAMDPIAHGTFWSLFFNTTFFIGGSILFRQSAKERNLAELYVDIYDSQNHDDRILWRGSLVYKDLKDICTGLLGKQRTKDVITFYLHEYGDPLNEKNEVSPRFVNYIERIMSGVVGSASARLLISSVSREEDIELTDVLKILKESSEVARLNQELKLKSFELEKRTDELEKANQRLRYLDVEKDDFISTVTHEMRTPLTSIKALVEILHDNSDISKVEKRKFLDTVIIETERMTRLINQVLDLEKLESGTIEIIKRPVNLIEVLNSSIETVGQLMVQKGIELTKTGFEERIEISGDEDRLKQVFINLLSNAIKFTPEDSGKIELSVHKGERQIFISFIDNGKGIAKDDADRIFDKFYQVRDQVRKKPKGSGLGLSITRQIIELHGGEISVESQIHKGSEFKIKLPLDD